MLPVFLRTLSARILVGFAVLIVTFGATTVWAVTYMNDLTDEISIIRTGYLTIALDTEDLTGRQQALQKYIDDELSGEGTPSIVQKRVNSMRTKRDTLIERIAQTLEPMKDLPRGHGQRMHAMLEKIGALQAAIAALDTDYSTMLSAPPIERTVKAPTPPFDPAVLEAAERARLRLVTAETSINRQVSEIAADASHNVDGIAKNLERNADRLRKFTLWMGIIAVAAGLLITVWATVTLRPLARLREASARIARGEHGLRIDERGPVEVADLAREFNVMARAIEERERELVRSERLAAVGKMAAMITHEVRNPLSSIALNTDLLGDELDKLGDADTAEARALCRAITYEVDRLTGITEEYLAYARLPKPRLAVEAVNPVVESLATFVKEDLASRKVELSLALAEGLPKVMLDEAQIRQSLLNLVRNAAEALGDSGGQVTLTTRGQGSSVEIEVADDGPGVPEDLRARLFDPFVTTKAGGTGLGLALTLQIVRDHGGDIRIESTPGRGAAFVVALPRATEA